MTAAIGCTRQKPGHNLRLKWQTTAREIDWKWNANTYLFGRNLDTNLLNGFGKFFWLNQDLCIAKSTGTESEEYEGSGKWYVNVKWDACVQDCSVDNGDDCEGPPEWLGKALYDTKKQCCDTVLFWLSDECY